MLLVVFCVIGIIVLLFSLLLFSTIRIRIQNFSKSNYDEITKELGDKDFKIKLELVLFEKLKFLSLSLNSERMKKLYDKQQLENIDIEKLKSIAPGKEELWKIVKDLDLEVTKFQLEIMFGTEDVLLTTAMVCVLASGIGIILPKIMKKINTGNCNYHVIPIYQNKNQYKVQLNCIINLKMVHIICMLNNILKRRRVEKNDRTSHRRAYDYSYE